MSYQVIARKCRPQTFDEVVGQQHVTRTLTNAIKEKRIAHAFLFTGERGVGKTSVARLIAAGLLLVIASGTVAAFMTGSFLGHVDFGKLWGFTYENFEILG